MGGQLTRTRYGDRSFAVQGTCVWNILTAEHHDLEISLYIFCNRLKTFGPRCIRDPACIGTPAQMTRTSASTYYTPGFYCKVYDSDTPCITIQICQHRLTPPRHISGRKDHTWNSNSVNLLVTLIPLCFQCQNWPGFYMSVQPIWYTHTPV